MILILSIVWYELSTTPVSQVHATHTKEKRGALVHAMRAIQETKEVQGKKEFVFNKYQSNWYLSKLLGVKERFQ